VIQTLSFLQCLDESFLNNTGLFDEAAGLLVALAELAKADDDVMCTDIDALSSVLALGAGERVLEMVGNIGTLEAVEKACLILARVGRTGATVEWHFAAITDFLPVIQRLVKKIDMLKIELSSSNKGMLLAINAFFELVGVSVMCMAEALGAASDGILIRP